MRKLLLAPVIMILTLAASIAGAQAACTIPNRFMNTQSADATQVMNNFDSLAACAAPLASPSFTGNISVTGTAAIGGGQFYVSGLTGQYTNAVITSHGGVGNGYAARLLLINTDNAAFELNMADSGGGTAPYTEAGMLTMSTSSGYGIKINTNNTNNNGLRIATSGATSCYPSCSNVSDKRIKTNIAALSPAEGLTAIGALRPVSYRWKDSNSGREQQIGLLAQEVRAVFPQVVTNTGIVTKDAPDGILALNYGALTAPMVLSIQQLDARTKAVAIQSEKIIALENANRELFSQIRLLQTQVNTLARSSHVRTAKN